MADAATLASVKNALGVTSDFMDTTISIYIDDVTDDMSGAGVPDSVIAASVGVIARGVNDLWTASSGDAKYSPYFYDRVSQLVLRSRG
jgi:putative N-acetylmannosamine-6-phosphate epimerase